MNEPSAEHEAEVSSSGKSDPAIPAQIGVNGVQWASGAPWQSPLTLEESRRLIEEHSHPPPDRMNLADSGEDLSEAGWGVVYGPDVDGATKEALRPLLELRRTQAGGDEGLFSEMQVQDGESAEDFLARQGGDGDWADPQIAPTFLLMVGRNIPFELQTSFPLPYNVGRLSLTSPEEYAAYAQAAADAELSPQLRPRRVALAGTDGGEDSRFPLMTEDLMESVERSIALARPSWDAITLTQGLTTQRRLAQLLADSSETPAVLVTAGRSVCAAGNGRLFDLVGALVCCDYSGGELNPEHVFDAGKVSQDARLNGLMVLLQGSFTAGRPAHPLLDRLRGRPAGETVEATLPRRLLGRKSGPALAVLGHCECCWLHLAARSQREEWAGFMTSFLEGLLQRQSVGAALQDYRRRCCQLADRLENEPNANAEKQFQRRLEAWALRQEARNWILMGDPAGRLPVAL
ncbi:MAG TPA: hypothetical protein VLV83_02910 [Acidobacteriota bacterium]|nr:hypothetical protein [Acidobacteriota bacterium]